MPLELELISHYGMINDQWSKMINVMGKKEPNHLIF